jgi:hypothetical protein
VSNGYVLKPGHLHGDFNGDGHRDKIDIKAFVRVLSQNERRGAAEPAKGEGSAYLMMIAGNAPACRQRLRTPRTRNTDFSGS